MQLRELKECARHEQIVRWNDKVVNNKFRKSDYEQERHKNAETRFKVGVWKDQRRDKLNALLAEEGAE